MYRWILCLGLILAQFPMALAAADDQAAADGPDGLRYARIRFMDQPFDVLWVDLQKARLELFWQDENDRPFRNFSRLREALEAQGRQLLFATNSGIYGKDRMPLGLHVANGVALQRINHGPGGGGNFYLKPNGIFFIENNKPFIRETSAYAAAEHSPSLAVQSGPLMLEDGKIHPRFIPGSDSTHIRNGVGIVDEHTVVFAVSLYPVNFHDFTRLFQEELACSSALYLDGSLSSMYVSFVDRKPRGGEFVGIIGVTAPIEDEE